MITAVLAIVTSAQASPADRLVKFMNNAPQRGTTFTASSGPLSIKCKFSFQLPAYQYFELIEKDARVRYIQTPKRIAVFQDYNKTYFEFRGFNVPVNPPPDAGVAKDIYPMFIWSWFKADGLKDAVADGSETLDGIAVDWIKQEIETEAGTISVRTAVTAEGSPKKVVFSDPENATITYNFDEFSWPYFDIKAWKYQPPTGYMLGNAPRPFYPLRSGSKVDFKGWGDELSRLNKKGIAIIVTAADSKPDQTIQPALKDMQKALEKLGLKVAEVHLDATQAPKRDWPVLLDKTGTINRQLDVPVTPYIFFVGADNIVLKAWAGYGEDQRKNLIKTAVETYNPPEDEE